MQKAGFCFVVVMFSLWQQGEGIGCYACQSKTKNTTHVPCGDPFNSSHVAYVSRCMQGMSGRTGEFPAHFCIKMQGVSVEDNTQLFVRTCSITTMGHQCGEFKFEDVKYKGCLTSCDKDACNKAGKPLLNLPLFGLALVIMLR